jgi:hypothetical protein
MRSSLSNSDKDNTRITSNNSALVIGFLVHGPEHRMGDGRIFLKTSASQSYMTTY